MVAIINPYRASSHALEPLSGAFSSNRTDRIIKLPLSYIATRHYYKIEYIRKSENAWLLFVLHMATKERFVIKVLCKYKDTRYSLETIDKRQQCQLEALQWNRIITPGVYVGLARICDFDVHRKSIVIDEIIENPTKEMLEPSADYALLMRQIPMDRRLDYILNKEKKASLHPYIHILTKRLVQLHENIGSLSIEDGKRWGEFEQLERKLEHNLELANPVLIADRHDQYSFYKWWQAPLNCLKGTLLQMLPQVQYDCFSSRCKDIFTWLKDSLLQVFTDYRYRDYFEQRVQERHIKHCHGDLKAPNILIAPPPYDSFFESEPEKYVWILDAIDFNPMYCNIDVLSDLAMLVIDIHVRTGSSSLADLMIKDYLKLTKQENEVSRLVLAYYLVEKAYVGAAISFVYDNLPNLGWAFLNVAKMRMEYLKCQVEM